MNKAKTLISRTIAIILSCTFILQLCSCGKKSSSESIMNDPNENFIDNVVTQDYEGQTFSIAITTLNKFELFAEENTGNSENDAIYNRNDKIAKRFNIDFNFIEYEQTEQIHDAFRSGCMAGDMPFDLAMDYAYATSELMMEHLLINWLEVPEIDINQKWWNQLSNDELTVNNKLYALTGDLAMTTMAFTYAMFVNIDLASDWGIDIDELYSMVIDGKWTLDKMIEMVRNIYSDTNGNQEQDEEDVYGFYGSPSCSTDPWQIAVDNPITTKTSDGHIEFTFLTEKMLDTYDKIFNLYHDTDGAYLTSTWYKEKDYFASGKTVFASLYFYRCFEEENVKSMQDNYTVVPFPKYNEDQTNYYSGIDDKYSILLLPIVCEDTSFVGSIVEAMCAETYNTVMPIWYDIALKGKYANDTNTQKMMDIIMEGRKFDMIYAFYYDFPLMGHFVRSLLGSKNPNLASKYAAYLKKSQNRMAEIEDVFFEED